MTTTCERCGQVYGVGQWYQCPHEPMTGVVHSDRLANPWIEHLDHEPVYCETKQDLQREMDKRGLRLRDQWAGPHDRHLTNWAAGIDPYTLESAAILLSRGSRAESSPSPGQLETLKTEVRIIKKWSEVE